MEDYVFAILIGVLAGWAVWVCGLADLVHSGLERFLVGSGLDVR